MAKDKDQGKTEGAKPQQQAKAPKKEKAAAEVGPHYGRLCNVEQIGVTTADAMCAFFGEGHNVEKIGRAHV